MAIIGFLLITIIGIAFVFAALAAAWVSAGFSGKIEWPAVLLYGVIGGAALYFAWTHAPFTIHIAGAAS